MRTSREVKRKTGKFKVILLGIVVILFIIICIASLIKGRIPFYPQKVVAGELVEEVSDINKINTDKANEDTIVINGENKDISNYSEDNKDTENEGVSRETQDIINSKNNSKELIANLDDILVVVNKKRYLPSDYKPRDLVVPNVKFSFEGEHEKRYLRQEAANALEELFNKANEEGILLFAVSGYRSYNTQEYLFNRRASMVGEEEANKLSARPGESEHQTGLAMDVSSQSVKFDLIEGFGSTTEGKWVNDNAHKFGFIIRYLKDKTDITGYNYEPWHIRYVGKDVAEKIYSEGITLEEFLGFE